MAPSDARALPGDPIDVGQSEWRTELAVARLPWLRDHIVADMVLLPGAAYLDAGLAVAAQTTGRPAPALDEVRFITPLVVEHNDVPTLRLTMESSSGRFTVSSRGSSATSWTRHASGRIVDGLVRPTLALPVLTDAAATADEVYPRAGRARPGVRAGLPADRRSPGERRPGAGSRRCHHRHRRGRPTTRPTRPCWTPRCSASPCWPADDASVGGAVVPAAVRHVRQFAALSDHVLVGVTRVASESGEAKLVADVVLTDPAGQVLVELHRVQGLPVSPRRPFLSELDRLWLEPFEPREPRDSAGRANALALERVFLVAAGEERPGAPATTPPSAGPSSSSSSAAESRDRSVPKRRPNCVACWRPTETTPARWWSP